MVISENFNFLMNMGNIYSWIVFGVVAGIYSFIVAVFLEAFISRKFFSKPARFLILYSFMANLTSAGCGIIFVILGFNPIGQPTKWLSVAFVLSIIVEFFWWVLLLKAKATEMRKVFIFCIAGNAASYAFILVTPVVITIVNLFIIA